MNRILAIAACFGALLLACSDSDESQGHGPMAEGIYAPMGQPLPGSTPEQLAAFERGREVAEHRFDYQEGLGPAFNVTFCGSCHERPVTGGSAGLYRSFFIGAEVTEDGAFFPARSAGEAGGVIRIYQRDTVGPERPALGDEVNVIAQRNPIPFFGVGLLAELPEDEILRRADPDDADGDGVSGRPNYDRGFVGRFGVKAQTVSIEGFIRGPLFNHLGITTEPLTDEQRAALPVDSSNPEMVLAGAALSHGTPLHGTAVQAQAAAPDGPTLDDDGVPDPEMTGDELFDLVTFSMLLAIPEPEPLTERTTIGRDLFDRAECGTCHAPRLEGPRGPLPVYSDLLLHDMGPDLADGLVFGEATGSEFRTQPLWGIAAVGPYLHDGRATTICDAILMHGGEGQRSRDIYAGFTREEQDLVVEFLLSLGGRDQFSPGLIPPGTPIPAVGEFGGPLEGLDGDDLGAFSAGRALFDREFGLADGLGAPRFNGDSCRACHFEPTVGGAGPRGVNVMRHGILNADGEFVPPSIGTVLHRLTILPGSGNRPQPEVTVFEARQTPHLFGLGLIDGIPEEVILANADPDDADGDGISGRPSWSDGGRLGRFGWKAQVPSIAEFVRDAVTVELGMTTEFQDGLSFGRIQDNDPVPDPEITAAEADAIAAYLAMLGPPPRQEPLDPAEAARGDVLFDEIGCAGCHVRELDGADGPVALFSDLLLHETLPPDAVGIEEFSANVREFRTAPLWGLSSTAPYLHDGAADTIDEAIRGHDGEARASRDAFEAAPAADRSALIAFLETL